MHCSMNARAHVHTHVITRVCVCVCACLCVFTMVHTHAHKYCDARNMTKALVENAMEHAAQQAEDEKVVLKKKVRGAMPSLLKIFHTIDKDNSGMITRDELQNVPMDILPPKVLAAVCVDNWEELFEYLDIDGTGSLSQAQEDQIIHKIALHPVIKNHTKGS